MPGQPAPRTPKEREKVAKFLEDLANQVRTAEVLDAGLTVENDLVTDKDTGVITGTKPKFTQITVWWG